MEISRKIYDVTSPPIVSLCIRLGITGNMITVLNHVLTLTLGVYLFAQGTYAGWIGGLLICFVNGFLDYLDGDVAKKTGAFSKFGVWLDSGFDVIVQNAVMGAIAFGCWRMELPVFWIILFFVGNASCNFVSFHYNTRLGFDSDKGNKVFRSVMDEKPTLFNNTIQGLIDPTCHPFFLVLYTYRYFILVGCITNTMPLCFYIMTVIVNVRWVIMFLLYAEYLRGNRKLFILQTFSYLDEESDDYYSIRRG